jgi:hypothetical protein
MTRRALYRRHYLSDLHPFQGESYVTQFGIRYSWR